VLDVRRAVRWLEREGYTRIAILGTSMGSSVAYVTLAHEPALQVGAFLHVSTHFADVVRRGLTTAHVWETMKRQVSAEELRLFWAPISAFPYIERLKNRGLKILLFQLGTIGQ
jgi:pimeloyl-ACP methyl ester carboxylesterase